LLFEYFLLAPGFSRVNPVITEIRPVSTGFLEAVETAPRWYSIVITGLKPGANENFPPSL
jgi:hypothetical protein